MTLIVASLGICFAIVMPGALSGLVRDVALTKISAFADWRRAIHRRAASTLLPRTIRPRSRVYSASPELPLGRPVRRVVFSRATAMEVKRRSLCSSAVGPRLAAAQFRQQKTGQW